MLLAALLAFLAVGSFDSTFDSPRLTLLAGLLVAVAGTVETRQRTSASPLDSARMAADSVRPELATPAGAPPMRSPTWMVFTSILLLSILIALVTKLPFVPYNIRELPNPLHPIVAPVLLSALVLLCLGLPAVVARWMVMKPANGAMLPLFILAQGLIAWFLLRFAVLPESIHDVIGSPVLDWPLQLEYIARVVPLLSVLAVQITGGALLAEALMGTRMALAPVWWATTATVLFPIQYWVIVTQAGTDNLTELIGNNASAYACMLLSCYLFLIGLSASLLANLRKGGGVRSVVFVLVALVVTLPLGYLVLTTGTESNIFKHQSTFSAMQFILSTDRSNYAVGSELWLRFAVAHGAAVSLIAAAQYPLVSAFHAYHQRQKVSAPARARRLGAPA
jgi:hypothetical protein